MIFEDNFEPIKLTLKNKKGELFDIETIMVTGNDIKKIELIESSKNKKTYPTEMDKAYEILKIFFGKGEKFFSQFSMTLLFKIIKYIQAENKKKQKESVG